MLHRTQAAQALTQFKHGILAPVPVKRTTEVRHLGCGQKNPLPVAAQRMSAPRDGWQMILARVQHLAQGLGQPCGGGERCAFERQPATQRIEAPRRRKPPQSDYRQGHAVSGASKVLIGERIKQVLRIGAVLCGPSKRCTGSRPAALELRPDLMPQKRSVEAPVAIHRILDRGNAMLRGELQQLAVRDPKQRAKMPACAEGAPFRHAG